MLLQTNEFLSSVYYGDLATLINSTFVSMSLADSRS